MGWWSDCTFNFSEFGDCSKVQGNNHSLIGQFLFVWLPHKYKRLTLWVSEIHCLLVRKCFHELLALSFLEKKWYFPPDAHFCSFLFAGHVLISSDSEEMFEDEILLGMIWYPVTVFKF